VHMNALKVSASRKTGILDSESDEEDEDMLRPTTTNLFPNLSPRDEQKLSQVSARDSRDSNITKESPRGVGGSGYSHTRTRSANTFAQKLRKPGESVELPGARITAYQMGICTRMRLMDDINFE